MFMDGLLQASHAGWLVWKDWPLSPAAVAKGASKHRLEQMIKVRIQRARRWGSEPKPASSWWTGTVDSEEKMDFSTDTF